MRVIGTAGHVDHGKSTVVEAMTGYNPDRLREEQERGLTIVLGFAWLTLPNGEEVGIVDVPGHRDFIENMLSGVGAIDAALLVVAADEGVMPQTREHLAILDLLQVDGGIIALTKIDAVHEPEWLDLVELDIRETVADTVMESAPILRVSGRTGEGIQELIAVLGEVLVEKPPRPDLFRPRLSVDRVFTLAGFGTIVTGTLTDGHLRVGEEVEILPSKLRGRIRGLQTHKRKVENAVPGSRTAINISGIEVGQIQRGDVVAYPNDYTTTRRLDVFFRLLPDASQPVKHNMEVKLFIGAVEVISRVRLLGVELLRPGEEGWLQLELTHPVVAIRGDRYILRRPSPGETIGGGEVIDAHPGGRHKRFASSTLSRLETLKSGAPSDVLYQSLRSLGAATYQDLIIRSSLDREMADQAVKRLITEDKIKILDNLSDHQPKSDTLTISGEHWDNLREQILENVTNYHMENPLHAGMSREELKSRLNISTRLFDAILRKLDEVQIIAVEGPLVRLPEHEVRFTRQQQKRVNDLLSTFANSPHSPPTVKDAQNHVGEDVLKAMVDLGLLIQVSPEVVFRSEDYRTMVGEISDLLKNQGLISVAEVRDHFNTSRRYVLALLEHLDDVGITFREGDVRRLKRN